MMDCGEENIKYEEPGTSLEEDFGGTNLSTNMPRKEDPLGTFMSVEKATKIIAELGLLSLQLGDYMVVVKPDFDLMLVGEPYVALMLLFNLRNGTFISRVWNQTVKSGNIADTKQLVGECINHFEQRPCIGCPDEESEIPTTSGFLISQTPVPRKISMGCRKVIEKDVDEGYKSCRECLALSNALDPQCKVEIMETEEKTEDFEEKIDDECVAQVSSAMDTSHNICDEDDNAECIPLGENSILYSEHDSKETISKIKSNRWRNQIARELTDGTRDFFECPWCDRKFPQKGSAFYIHRKMDHFWGKFWCLKCQFKANFAKDLKKHMQNEDHTEESLANCPQCKKRFNFLLLEPHYEACIISTIKKMNRWGVGREVAPKEKCPWCEEYFVQGSKTLEFHKKREHLWGDFKCADCDFQANFAKNLIEHVERETHDDKQKVTCPRCQRRFMLNDIESHSGDCTTRETFFKCPWCPSMFTCDPKINWRNRFTRSSGPFFVHKKTVHFWGTFRCPECEFEANFAQELVDHMQHEGHVSEPSVSCPQCEQEFPFPELSSHYEACVQSLTKSNPKPTSTRTSFYGTVFPKKCDFCDYIASSYGGYHQHCTRKHFKGKFKCLKCKFVAHFAKDLVAHMETDGQGTLEGHMANPFSNCPICKERIHINEIGLHYEGCVKRMFIEKKEKFNKPKICEKCGKTVSQSNYKNHLKMHLRKQCASEDEVKTALANAIPNNQGDASLFHYCDKCDKRFAGINTLRIHIEQEHEKKEYKCKECEEIFKKYTQLKQHVILVHNTDKKYNCEHCGKRFNDTGNLKSHILHHHEAPRFKCSFCGRMFKDNKRLVSHERQHTGEKPFKCSVCDSAYTSKSGLNQHEAGAHNIDSARGRKLGWHGRNKTPKLDP